MQDILYNPIEKKFKNPVGAVLENEEISFTIGINKGFQINNLALLVHKDYSAQDDYHRLNYIQNDELYNYLIAGIKIKSGFKFISLHLYKCIHIVKTKKSFELSDEEKEQFNSILVYGPREVERRTVKTKIKLTENGIKKYKSMYLNRPIPTEIDGNIYTFNCSHDNLFLYFSRFGVDAEILEPLNLRNQVIAFHRKAYNKYINS